MTNIIVLTHLFKEYCKQNNLDKIKEVIETGERQNTEIDVFENTYDTLRSVSYNGFIDIMKYFDDYACKKHILIDYHFDDDAIFTNACNSGNIELIEWLWNKCKNDGQLINIHAWGNSCFKTACTKENFKLMKWLWNKSVEINSPIDINYPNGEPFYNLCENGNIELMKWLWDLGLKINNPINVNSYFNYPEEMNKDNIKNNIENHMYRKIQWPLYTCRTIESAEWVWSKYTDINCKKIDLHIFNQWIFKNACHNKKFELIKWLYSKSLEIDKPFTIDVDLFVSTCMGRSKLCDLYAYDNISVLKWLIEHRTSTSTMIVKNTGILNVLMLLYSSTFEIVKLIFELCDSGDVKLEIDNYSNFFRQLCTTSILEKIQLIYNQFSKMSPASIYSKSILANAHTTSIMDWLWNTFNTTEKPLELSFVNTYSCDKIKWLVNKAIETKRELDIHYFNERVFVEACRNDNNYDTIVWLWNISNDESLPFGTINIRAQSGSAYHNACSSNCIKIAKFLHDLLPEEYLLEIEDDLIIHWSIRDIMTNASPSNLDEITSLVKYIATDNDDIELCPICDETENLYLLNCSKKDSKHILCGKCILAIRKQNELKCQYCLSIQKLFD